MRRALPVLSAAALAVLMAACATPPAPPPPAPPRAPPPPPPPPPTPLEEFGWSQRPGNNTLVGVVNYRPAASQTWSCAGQAIALTPETSYSRGRMISLYGSAEQALHSVADVRTRSAANPGLDYSEFVRSTTCDTQDTFTFQGLPDGAYHIIARVRQTRPATSGEGMVIMQRVELKGGQVLRVTLPQRPAATPSRPASRPPARQAPRPR